MNTKILKDNTVQLGIYAINLRAADILECLAKGLAARVCYHEMKDYLTEQDYMVLEIEFSSMHSPEMVYIPLGVLIPNVLSALDHGKVAQKLNQYLIKHYST